MSDNDERLERLNGMLRRRGFILPAFEIHGGAKGLYDFGPVGGRLRSRINQTWLDHWLQMGNIVELSCPTVTVACAVEALESERVARILLVRPAVEAGEKLGFLPGDLSQKIDPYLRPLYDALYEMLGFERVHKLIERNVIEVAPLAYMRGRTLNNAFVILDESQNTTVEQMKMFLTRLGFGSTAVITGDAMLSGLVRCIRFSRFLGQNSSPS